MRPSWTVSYHSVVTEAKSIALTSLQRKMIPLAHSATVALGPKEGVFDLRDAQFASGIVLRKGKRRFIATVAHYISAVPLEEMTVTYAPRGLVYAKNDEEVLQLANRASWEKETTSSAPLRALWHRCGTDLEDVAVIEVSPESVPPWCWAPFIDEFSALQAMPNPEELLLLAGLPCRGALKRTIELATANSPAKADLARIGEMNYRQVIEVHEPAKWVNNEGKRRYFPKYHFALFYPTLDRVPPLGLSGGGVWRAHEGETRSGVIQPYPIPVGIENSYNDTRECVKITSIKRVTRLLTGPKQCDQCAGARTK
jgi:hypothetical protein